MHIQLQLFDDYACDCAQGQCCDKCDPDAPTGFQRAQKPALPVYGYVWRHRRHEDGCSYLPNYTPAHGVSQGGQLFALVDPADLHNPLGATKWE